VKSRQLGHVICGSESSHPNTETTLMDDKRRENGDRLPDREAQPRRDDNQQSDDLARRRELLEHRQALTWRERQERWPIG
jgi:hypothetical protein